MEPTAKVTWLSRRTNRPSELTRLGTLSDFFDEVAAFFSPAAEAAVGVGMNGSQKRGFSGCNFTASGGEQHTIWVNSGGRRGVVERTQRVVTLEMDDAGELLPGFVELRDDLQHPTGHHARPAVQHRRE